MKPSRLRAMLATFFVLGLPVAAVAGAGDPRLISGVVEWPPALTNEPFVIVRGNDGVLYYVGVAATRRDGTVSAGSRISVIGLEGRNRHEINAVGIGSGPTGEAALAQLLAAPAGDVAPSSTAKSAAATTQPSRQAAAQPSAPSPGVVPAAQSPKPTIDETASTPAPVARATPSPSIAPAPMMIPTDKPRWVELAGEVESVSASTLVLKVDGGRVSVDVSNLRAVERSLVPGATVKVYGVPVELRFKAMGFIETNARARGPRQN